MRPPQHFEFDMPDTKCLYILWVNFILSDFSEQTEWEVFFWQTMFCKLRTGLASGSQIFQIFSTQNRQNEVANFVEVLCRMLVKLKGKFFAESCVPGNFRLAKSTFEITNFFAF
jgi:hypothetical protein